jgi:hypothetical protein
MDNQNFKRILENPGSVTYALCKGVEAAMNAAKEYSPQEGDGGEAISEDMIKKGLDMLLEKYTEGSVRKKIVLNAAMYMPWSETLKVAYDLLLDIGKKGDGTFMNTRDTIIEGMKRYVVGR